MNEKIKPTLPVLPAFIIKVPPGSKVRWTESGGHPVEVAVSYDEGENWQKIGQMMGDAIAERQEFDIWWGFELEHASHCCVRCGKAYRFTGWLRRHYLTTAHWRREGQFFVNDPLGEGKAYSIKYPEYHGGGLVVLDKVVGDPRNGTGGMSK